MYRVRSLGVEARSGKQETVIVKGKENEQNAQGSF